jgi:hypothetical protein
VPQHDFDGVDPSTMHCDDCGAQPDEACRLSCTAIPAIIAFADLVPVAPDVYAAKECVRCTGTGRDRAANATERTGGGGTSSRARCARTG